MHRTRHTTAHTQVTLPHVPLDVVVGRVLGDVVYQQGADCAHVYEVARHTSHVTRHLRRGSTLK